MKTTFVPNRFRRTTTRRLRILLAVSGVLLVGIPPLSADPVRETLDRGSFTPEEEQSLLVVFENARLNDVPVYFFLPRLQEGISKNVDARRLRRALETDLAGFVEARDVARSVPGGDDLIADDARWARAATVLAAGRSPEELEDLVAATVDVPELFRPAAALYVSLAEWGLAEEDSLAIVRAAVGSPIPPENYPGIAELFAVARRERVRPDRMAERIVEGLARAHSLRTLRTLVVD